MIPEENIFNHGGTEAQRKNIITNEDKWRYALIAIGGARRRNFTINIIILRKNNLRASASPWLYYNIGTTIAA